MTGGRSSQVIVFGSSHGANHGPVAPPPSLQLPKSENSEPAAVKWNEPQLFTPTAPTLPLGPPRPPPKRYGELGLRSWISQ